MISRNILIDGELELRNLDLKDCSQEYADWLNDKEVNQFLTSRFRKEDIASCKIFVRTVNESSDSFLWGIFINRKHIGNIKLASINKIHRHAKVSYLIGNRKYWRKGYATRALRLVCDYAFGALNLNRISAGCCVLNIPSERVLLGVGFVLEGCTRKDNIIDYGSEYYDTKRFGLLKEEYIK
jgi:RimJ/RimL family protein N-acetyltransferase